MRRALARLRRDRRGVTVVEFAIVAPVMITLLLGLGDLLYQSYLQSILSGAVIKAGRDAALQANATDQSALDNQVKSMVGLLGPNMQFDFQRRSYASFALVKPENFTDKNGNGVRDPGECFDDVNNNKQWDKDPGILSQGGANDVTKYTVTVTYPRMFPVSRLFGWSATQQVSATTLLKNQPYKTQATQTVVSICT